MAIRFDRSGRPVVDEPEDIVNVGGIGGRVPFGGPPPLAPLKRIARQQQEAQQQEKPSFLARLLEVPGLAKRNLVDRPISRLAGIKDEIVPAEELAWNALVPSEPAPVLPILEDLGIGQAARDVGVPLEHGSDASYALTGAKVLGKLGTGLALDPLVAGLGVAGKLAKAGKLAGAALDVGEPALKALRMTPEAAASAVRIGAKAGTVGRVAAGVLAPQMGIGAFQAASEALRMGGEEGLTPRAAGAGLEAGMSALFAGGALRHALTSPKGKAAQRERAALREGMARRFPAPAEAPVPVGDLLPEIPEEFPVQADEVFPFEANEALSRPLGSEAPGVELPWTRPEPELPDVWRGMTVEEGMLAGDAQRAERIKRQAEAQHQADLEAQAAEQVRLDELLTQGLPSERQAVEMEAAKRQADMAREAAERQAFAERQEDARQEAEAQARVSALVLPEQRERVDMTRLREDASPEIAELARRQDERTLYKAAERPLEEIREPKAEQMTDTPQEILDKLQHNIPDDVARQLDDLYGEEVRQYMERNYEAEGPVYEFVPIDLDAGRFDVIMRVKDPKTGKTRIAGGGQVMNGVVYQIGKDRRLFPNAKVGPVYRAIGLWRADRDFITTADGAKQLLKRMGSKDLTYTAALLAEADPDFHLRIPHLAYDRPLTQLELQHGVLDMAADKGRTVNINAQSVITEMQRLGIPLEKAPKSPRFVVARPDGRVEVRTKPDVSGTPKTAEQLPPEQPGAVPPVVGPRPEGPPPAEFPGVGEGGAGVREAVLPDVATAPVPPPVQPRPAEPAVPRPARRSEQLPVEPAPAEVLQPAPLETADIEPGMPFSEKDVREESLAEGRAEPAAEIEPGVPEGEPRYSAREGVAPKLPPSQLPESKREPVARLIQQRFGRLASVKVAADGDGWAVKLPNGTVLRITPIGRIEIDPRAFRAEYERDPTPADVAVGSERPGFDGQRLIDLVEGQASFGDLVHEDVHALMRVGGLTEREIGSLTKQYGKDLAGEMGRLADARRAADAAKRSISQPSWFSRLWEYLRRLAGAFRASSDYLTESIQSGRIHERGMGERLAARAGEAVSDFILPRESIPSQEAVSYKRRRQQIGVSPVGPAIERLSSQLKRTTDPAKRQKIQDLIDRYEELPDLMVFHESSPEGLLRSVEAGGLSVPSLGVVPRGEQYNWSDITLVGRKDMVEPKRTGVGDVYTATIRGPVQDFRKEHGRNPSADELTDFILKNEDKYSEQERFYGARSMRDVRDAAERYLGQQSGLDESADAFFDWDAQLNKLYEASGNRAAGRGRDRAGGYGGRIWREAARTPPRLREQRVAELLHAEIDTAHRAAVDRIQGRGMKERALRLLFPDDLVDEVLGKKTVETPEVSREVVQGFLAQRGGHRFLESKSSKTLQIGDFAGALVNESVMTGERGESGRRAVEELRKAGVPVRLYRGGSAEKAEALAKFVPEISKEEPDVVFSAQKRKPGPLGYYSQLERIVEDSKTPKAGKAVDFLNYLKGPQRQVKQAELYWTGLEDWLKAKGEARISKDELVNFVRENQVEVREVTRDEQGQRLLDAREETINALADAHSRNAPASEIEVLRRADQEAIDRINAGGPGALLYASRIEAGGTNQRELFLILPGGTNQRELLLTLPGEAKFTGVHYPEPNILAHARVNDRVDKQGKKVLFVEEVQSEWGEKGRDEGFDSTALDRISTAKSFVASKLGLSVPALEKEFHYSSQLSYLVLAKQHGWSGDISVNRPKPGPFVTKTEDWTNLALRRILQHAAQEGYDKIAWTTGEMQADRYELKDGEGMRVYYDKIIPDLLNKIGKKFGARVGETTIGGAPGESRTVRALDITPEMRQSITEEGMPLFSIRQPKAASGVAPRVERRIEDLETAVGEQAKVEGKLPLPEVLERETKRRWKEELAPEVRALLRERDDQWFFGEMKKRALTDSEKQAWDARVRMKWETREQGLANLEQARGVLDSLPKGSKDRAAVELEVAEASKNFLRDSLEHVAAVRSQLNDNTGTARALAALRKIMEASKFTGSDQVVRKLSKEFPEMTDAEVLDLSEAFSKDPARFEDLLHQAVKTGRMDKALELWKAGLLTSWSTHAANAIGNNLELGVRVGETAAASGVDWLLAKKTGVRSRHLEEVGAEIGGALLSAKPALRHLTENLKHITDPRLSAASSRKFEHQIGATKGIPGMYAKSVFNALAISDEVNRELGSGAELSKRAIREARRQLGESASSESVHQRQAEIIKGVWDGDQQYSQMVREIAQNAGERVYQADVPRGSVGSFGKWLSAAVQRHKTLQFVFPFIRTPANILDLTVERSPYGFKRAVVKYRELRSALRSGADAKEINRLQGETADAFARPLVGTTIMALFSGLALKGGITGSGPTDPDEQRLLKSTGWQPHSFVIPVGADQKWYLPLNRFEPVSSLIGLAADAAEIAQSGGDPSEVFERGVGSIVDNLTNKTYLQGLADAASAYKEPKQFLGTYIAGMAGSLVPAIVAHSEWAVSPELSETRPSQGGWAGIPERAVRTVASRIPGVSGMVPSKMTGTGETAERPVGALGGLLGPAGSAIERFASPAITSRSVEDREVEREMAAVNYSPSAPGRSYTVTRGVKIPLNQDELEVFWDERRKMTNRLRTAILNRRYLALDPEERKQFLQKRFGLADDNARSRIRGRVLRRWRGEQAATQ